MTGGRFYFAGTYPRRAELDGYAKRFVNAQLGFVTSTWLNTPQEGPDSGFSAGQLDTPEASAIAWKYAEQDLYDAGRADAIVSFTGSGGRGGRHVEHGFVMGIALTLRPMRIIVVGPREHVFHCHPDTEVYADFDEFMAHEMRNREETGK